MMRSKDPTRSATLRRLMATEVRRRFDAVFEHVVQGFEFGIDGYSIEPLRDRIEALCKSYILQPWWERYLDQAYDKGVGRAWDDLHKTAPGAQHILDVMVPNPLGGVRAQFIRQLRAKVVQNFDPDQPRAPKGSETGGQWVSERLTSVPDSSLNELWRHGSKNEAGRYFDAETGAPVSEVVVGTGATEVDTGLPSRFNKPVIQVHTHPQEAGFSDADWGLLGWSDVKGMVVVGPSFVYELQKVPSDRNPTPRDLREGWESFLVESENESDLESPTYVEDVLHRISEKLAAKFPTIRYRRTKRTVENASTLSTSRVYTDFKGVTDEMQKKILQEVTKGLEQRLKPKQLATNIKKAVTSITKSRALAIAETEITKAHAEGQLDALEELGETHVGVAVEWETREDGKVCRMCQALDGVVLKVSEARGLIPRHPRCRCAFMTLPTGRYTLGQKRSKKSVKSALDRSTKLEGPARRSLQAAKRRSDWEGARRRISKNRPKR